MTYRDEVWDADAEFKRFFSDITSLNIPSNTTQEDIGPCPETLHLRLLNISPVPSKYKGIKHLRLFWARHHEYVNTLPVFTAADGVPTFNAPDDDYQTLHHIIPNKYINYILGFSYRYYRHLSNIETDQMVKSFRKFEGQNARLFQRSRNKDVLYCAIITQSFLIDTNIGDNKRLHSDLIKMIIRYFTTDEFSKVPEIPSPTDGDSISEGWEDSDTSETETSTSIEDASSSSRVVSRKQELRGSKEILGSSLEAFEDVFPSLNLIETLSLQEKDYRKGFDVINLLIRVIGLREFNILLDEAIVESIQHMIEIMITVMRDPGYKLYGYFLIYRISKTIPDKMIEFNMDFLKNRLFSEDGTLISAKSKELNAVQFKAIKRTLISVMNSKTVTEYQKRRLVDSMLSHSLRVLKDSIQSKANVHIAAGVMKILHNLFKYSGDAFPKRTAFCKSFTSNKQLQTYLGKRGIGNLLIRLYVLFPSDFHNSTISLSAEYLHNEWVHPSYLFYNLAKITTTKKQLDGFFELYFRRYHKDITIQSLHSIFLLSGRFGDALSFRLLERNLLNRTLEFLPRPGVPSETSRTFIPYISLLNSLVENCSSIADIIRYRVSECVMDILRFTTDILAKKNTQSNEIIQNESIIGYALMENLYIDLRRNLESALLIASKFRDFGTYLHKFAERSFPFLTELLGQQSLRSNVRILISETLMNVLAQHRPGRFDDTFKPLEVTLLSMSSVRAGIPSSQMNKILKFFMSIPKAQFHNSIDDIAELLITCLRTEEFESVQIPDLIFQLFQEHFRPNYQSLLLPIVRNQLMLLMNQLELTSNEPSRLMKFLSILKCFIERLDPVGYYNQLLYTVTTLYDEHVSKQTKHTILNSEILNILLKIMSALSSIHSNIIPKKTFLKMYRIFKREIFEVYTDPHGSRQDRSRKVVSVNGLRRLLKNYEHLKHVHESDLGLYSDTIELITRHGVNFNLEVKIESISQYNKELLDGLVRLLGTIGAMDPKRYKKIRKMRTKKLFSGNGTTAKGEETAREPSNRVHSKKFENELKLGYDVESSMNRTLLRFPKTHPREKRQIITDYIHAKEKDRMSMVSLLNSREEPPDDVKPIDAWEYTYDHNYAAAIAMNFGSEAFINYYVVMHLLRYLDEQNDDLQGRVSSIVVNILRGHGKRNLDVYKKMVRASVYVMASVAMRNLQEGIFIPMALDISLRLASLFRLVAKLDMDVESHIRVPCEEVVRLVISRDKFYGIRFIYFVLKSKMSLPPPTRRKLLHNVLYILDSPPPDGSIDNWNSTIKFAVGCLFLIDYDLAFDFRDTIVRSLTMLIRSKEIYGTTLKKILDYIEFMQKTQNVDISSFALSFTQSIRHMPAQVLSEDKAKRVAANKKVPKTPASPSPVPLEDAFYSRLSVKPDVNWEGWLHNLIVFLVDKSPDKTLQCCIPIIDEMKLTLFLPGMVSMLKVLSDYRRVSGIISSLLSSPSVPVFIQNMLLDLYDFLGLLEQRLEISSLVLADAASRSGAVARAILYAETRYAGEKTTRETFSILIKLYNKLGYRDSTVGLVSLSEKYGIAKHREWYVELSDWEEAPGYLAEERRRLYRDSPEDISSIHDIEIRIAKTHSNAKEWDQVEYFINPIWDKLPAEKKRSVAPLATRAAWNLGHSENIKKYSQYLDLSTVDGLFLDTLVKVRTGNHEDAKRSLRMTREMVGMNMTSLLAEGYNSAYGEIVTAQQLEEIREVILYRYNKVTRGALRDLWTRRLSFVKKESGVWEDLLSIHGLVLRPRDNRRNIVKLATLSPLQGVCHRRLRSLHKGGAKQNLFNGTFDAEDLYVEYHYLKFLLQLGKREKVARGLSSRLEVLRGVQMDRSGKINKLVAKMFFLAGKVAETPEEQRRLLREAKHLYPDYLAAREEWAKLNLDLFYKTDNVSYLYSSIRGLIHTLRLVGKKGALGVLLQLLNIYYQYKDKYPGIVEKLRRSGGGKIPLRVWLLVIPQLISKIDATGDAVLSEIVEMIGREFPQPLAFPLTLSRRVSRAKSKMSKILFGVSHRDNSRSYRALEMVSKEAGLLFKDVRLLSDELIKLATTPRETLLDVVENGIQLLRLGQFGLACDTLKFLHGAMSRNGVPLFPGLDERCDSLLLRSDGDRQQVIRPISSDDVRDDRNASGYLLQAIELFLQYMDSKSGTVLGECIDTMETLRNCLLADVRARRTLTLSKGPLLGRFSVCVPGTYSLSSPPKKSEEPKYYIDHFEKVVSVMPTRKRPRRLSIVDSSGHSHTFLLKGKEDIQQESRAMQMFEFVNNLLRNHRSTKSGLKRYKIVPLTTNLGLIEWVKNSLTLGEIVARNRKHLGISPDLEKQRLEEFSGGYDELERIQRVECLEYSLETCRSMDLRDFMRRSSGSSEDYLAQRYRYTSSTAVTGVVEYLVGIRGRPHTSIMIERETGVTFHLDYSKIFRGTGSKAPLRLTRMLVNAMEITGVHGVFRNTFHRSLSVLTESKKLLHQFIKTFNFDPIVSTDLQWVDSLGTSRDLYKLFKKGRVFNENYVYGNENIGIIMQLSDPGASHRFREKISRDLNERFDSEPRDTGAKADRLIRESMDMFNIASYPSSWNPYW